MNALVRLQNSGLGRTGIRHHGWTVRWKALGGRALPGLLLLLVAAVMGPRVQAQDLANLAGTVTDPTGATVSRANVEARQVDTGLKRSTSTDDTGRFRLFALPVGNYELHVSKQGFSEDVRTGIHLVVAQYAVIDIAMQVGGQSDQVTV